MNIEELLPVGTYVKSVYESEFAFVGTVLKRINIFSAKPTI